MNLRQSGIIRVIAFTTAALSACHQSASNPPSQPRANPAQGAPATVAPWDTAAPERDRLMAEVLKTIAGREMSPAESVFKNVQLPGLKPVRAGQFLRIMNLGFARSLGVSCTHCHVSTDWASDEKPPKVVARSMIPMTNQLTRQIRSFQGVNQTANVTCTTCHRGVVKPATSLPTPEAR